jgi:hypothetical protein
LFIVGRFMLIDDGDRQHRHDVYPFLDIRLLVGSATSPVDH